MAIRHRLQQLLTRAASTVAGENPLALARAWASSMQPAAADPAAAQRCSSSARALHSATWPDVSSRRGMFAELPLVSSMLPNRKHMVAQFSPHGLVLVPRSLLEPTSATAPPPLPAMAATAASTSSQPSLAPAVQEPTNPQQQAPMMVGGSAGALYSSPAQVSVGCPDNAARHLLPNCAGHRHQDAAQVGGSCLLG